MPDVGVRELKARAPEIIREVLEERARYTISQRNRRNATVPSRQPY